MAEIDLVPVRYHRRRAYRAWVVRGLLVYLAVAMLVVGVRVLLAHWSASYDQEIASLNVQRERVEEEQRRLGALDAERQSLSQRLAVLEGLRGGIAAKQMFKVVDDSLDEQVWFRAWSFRRAGEIVEDEREAIETGYFIVLPQEAGEEQRKAWRFNTHMEFNAEAADHSALAGFVRRLAQQREIENARILSTRARNPADEGRVEFELAVVVRSAG